MPTSVPFINLFTPIRYPVDQANKCHTIFINQFLNSWNFSSRVQLNLQTMLCLLSNPFKVFILIIPLTFRPPKGRGRPFLWVANSFQASKFSIRTLFQSRPSCYQGNVVRLLGVKLNQKVTSGEPSKFPVHSYYLGNLTLMLCLYYYQFPLGLLFFYPD